MLKTVESLPLLGTQNAEYSQTMWTHTIGKRSYELQNHLGNVLSVISDKPLPHDDDSDGVVDWYLADIKQSTDYSPFGVQLSGRTLTNSSVSKKYRMGYQGSEMDNEVKGSGNSYTTEFRQLDPRLGRWLTLDPMMAKFPWQSPYCSMNNNPIMVNDINGLEGEPKQGETRTQDGVQEVFTGSVWECASEVVTFPASGGNGVFTRGGEAGTYNYQLIETIYVVIGGGFYNKEGTVALSKEYSGQVGTNGWMVASMDIENAYKYFREKFGDCTFDNMVIITHGNHDSHDEYTSQPDMSGYFMSVKPNCNVGRYVLKEARYGKNYRHADNEYKSALAIVSFLNRVNEGGTVTLSACTIGLDDKLMMEIACNTAPGVSIYCNMDKSSPSIDLAPGIGGFGFPLSVEIITTEKNYHFGWARWGVNNQENVDKGATPREGYRRL